MVLYFFSIKVKANLILLDMPELIMEACEERCRKGQFSFPGFSNFNKNIFALFLHFWEEKIKFRFMELFEKIKNYQKIKVRIFCQETLRPESPVEDFLVTLLFIRT